MQKAVLASLVQLRHTRPCSDLPTPLRARYFLPAALCAALLVLPAYGGVTCPSSVTMSATKMSDLSCSALNTFLLTSCQTAIQPSQG